jgi:hypothetical protein
MGGKSEINQVWERFDLQNDKLLLTWPGYSCRLVAISEGGEIVSAESDEPSTNCSKRLELGNRCILLVVPSVAALQGVRCHHANGQGLSRERNVSASSNGRSRRGRPWCGNHRVEARYSSAPYQRCRLKLWREGGGG